MKPSSLKKKQHPREVKPVIIPWCKSIKWAEHYAEDPDLFPPLHEFARCLVERVAELEKLHR